MPDNSVMLNVTVTCKEKNVIQIPQVFELTLLNCLGGLKITS